MAASPSRLVALVSGAGTNLQALLDACAQGVLRRAGWSRSGADRAGITALARAQRPRDPHVHAPGPGLPGRARWDRALAGLCAAFQPDLVISAGFMKLVGPDFLARSPAGSSTPTRRCCRRSPACTGSGTPSRTG